MQGAKRKLEEDTKRQARKEGVHFQSRRMSRDGDWTDSSQPKKGCPVACGGTAHAQSVEKEEMEMNMVGM